MLDMFYIFLVTFSYLKRVCMYNIDIFKALKLQLSVATFYIGREDILGCERIFFS